MYFQVKGGHTIILPLNIIRTLSLVLFTSSFLAGLVGIANVQAQSDTPVVLRLQTDGVINSVKERLVTRTLLQAKEEGAALVVIQLDTPGGLLSSTRNIVEELLEAQIPVVVYVSPQGARAGSGGTFITGAANFAVMAPSTNIGAATPISSSGEDLYETLADKTTNDAAALIRSIAAERGRNAEKYEATVRKAASFTAREAVEYNMVDFIAADVDALLEQLHEQEAEVKGETRVLDTRDIQIKNVDKNVLEHLLEFISDPNVSFILLTVGGLGIVVELLNPGLFVPGVVGAICLLLAFLALGNLPVNWAGVVFIVLAIGLAVLEIQVVGFGILGVGAVVSLMVGGLILFTQFGTPSPTLPAISVNRWLLAGFGSGFALVLIYLLRVVSQSRKVIPETVVPSMIGATGIVTLELAPQGVIRIGNETWTASNEDDTVVAIGEEVTVTMIDGLIAIVSRKKGSDS